MDEKFDLQEIDKLSEELFLNLIGLLISRGFISVATVMLSIFICSTAVVVLFSSNSFSGENIGFSDPASVLNYSYQIGHGCPSPTNDWSVISIENRLSETVIGNVFVFCNEFDRFRMSENLRAGVSSVLELENPISILISDNSPFTNEYGRLPLPSVIYASSEIIILRMMNYQIREIQIILISTNNANTDNLLRLDQLNTLTFPDMSDRSEFLIYIPATRPFFGFPDLSEGTYQLWDPQTGEMFSYEVVIPNIRYSPYTHNFYIIDFGGSQEGFGFPVYAIIDGDLYNPFTFFISTEAFENNYDRNPQNITTAGLDSIVIESLNN